MKIILLIFAFAISGLSYSQSLRPNSLADLNTKDYLKQLDNQVFVSYSYIRNLGNFGDVYKSGSGITLNYGKYFPNSWLAILRVGIINHELRTGIDSGGYTNFKVYPLHVGGRFYVYKNIVMPYFSFMNGLNLVSTSNFLGDKDVEDQFLVRYAFQVGFGFDVKFARNFGANLNINYNNSFYEDYDIFIQQNSKMMTGFEYGAGLSYDLGK
ncbi:MAG: hypothetical protein ABI840_08455 [bacterium]